MVSVLDDNGVGHSFEYDYDKGTRQYYSYTKYPSGKVREVWYNRDGDLVRSDINGLTVKSVKYGSRVKWISDERGYTTRYDLDEWDNIVYSLYADDTWVKKTYSRPWNLLTSVDRMGIITEYEYDTRGNRIAMVEAKGTDVERRSEYSYTDSGKLASSTIKGGPGELDATTSFTYDAADRLLSISDPENRITTFSDYDSSSNPQTVTDGRGIKKHFTYDPQGNLLTIRDHDNKLLSEYKYDQAGNRSSVLNAYLKEYKFIYDSEKQLIKSEDPLGGSTSRDYNPAGKPSKITDQDGNVTSYVYDSFERIIETIDGQGNSIIYNYADGSGCSSCSGGIDLVTSINYPTFKREMSYDSRKRKVAETDVYDNKDRTTSYTYNGYGDMTQIVDPEGNATSYEYDALHRKISETDADGNISRFAYDSRSNLIELRDSNGGFTYFDYDLSNRLIKETKPLLQKTSYSYDNAGNLASMSDANGRKTVYSYDNNNRIIKTEIFASVTDATPAKTVSYSYNSAGSLTGYNDGITSATYSYDDLQRRISETVNYPSFSLSHSYTYYANGQKKSYTDPAGRIRTYSYDKAGKALGVDLGQAGQVSYNSYEWNRPKRITLPGGASLNFSYNGLQQVSAITGKDPAENPLIDYNYSYSASGNINKKATEHGDYDYVYDSIYRLTEITSPTEDEAYQYDALSNCISSADVSEWIYNRNNQLTNYSTTSFKYDKHGNMVEKTTAGEKSSFSYNVENRLQKISDNNGTTTASYYYDPYGRRLWKDLSGSKTYYNYNDEGLVGEYNQSGEELKTYGYQPGSPWTTNPLFIQIDNTYYWYQNDHLGTPQKIIASNGTVVWQGVQDGFGKTEVVVEDIVNNLRFPGQYFDAESGLHYNWNRYYSPDIGRYISADPIGLAGGINRFLYTGGDPVNWIDPFGYYRKKGESIFACTDRLAREVFGDLLDLADNLGYYGLGSAVVGYGTYVLASRANKAAKTGLLNEKVRPASKGGSLWKRLGNSRRAGKNIARIGALKTTLGILSKFSGALGLGATAGSVGMRAIFIKDCMDERCQ